jgi:hypothetical protein
MNIQITGGYETDLQTVLGDKAMELLALLILFPMSDPGVVVQQEIPRAWLAGILYPNSTNALDNLRKTPILQLDRAICQWARENVSNMIL